jgi:DNA-binding response OmpR family regulator
MKNDISILLAEDDANLGFVIRDNLIQEGFAVDLCKDGLEAFICFEKQQHHICILDVMMPKIDGFELAKKIRAKDSGIPILFLTARTMKEDRLRGFLVGGDDYITKPFSIEELICRINVFLRRSGVSTSENQVIVSECTLDYANLKLTVKGQRTRLTQMEADILLLLAKQQNKVVKRAEILTKVWGNDDYFSGRSLDVFITRIRKLLAADKQIAVENVHGVGFMLKVGNEL